MIYERQKLYKRIKGRYEAYLRDSIKHGLIMFVLSEKEADILAGVGYKRTQSIMGKYISVPLAVSSNVWIILTSYTLAL